MIEFDNITKTYGKTEVLHGVSLTVPEGQTLGLIGPNGSGKTTLLKMAVGLNRPTSGTVTLNGRQLPDVDARRIVSYMPQIAHFSDNASAADLMKLLTRIRQQDPLHQEELIDFLGLRDDWKKPIGQFSGGMKQKVSAIMAMAFPSDILILDEPTVGLDPHMRYLFKKTLLDRIAKGATTIITSHILSDLDELVDRIVSIQEGAIHFDGMVSNLKANNTNIEELLYGNHE